MLDQRTKSKKSKYIAGLTFFSIFALSLSQLNPANADVSLKKKVEITVSTTQTSRVNFSLGKAEPTLVSITGGSQTTASGFLGNCDLYRANGEKTYNSVSFRNDYVYSKVFTSTNGGDFFFECKNSSTKEEAKLTISFTSLNQVNKSSNGDLDIPAYEARLLRFKMSKDVVIFISTKGSSSTTASSSFGSCDIYNENGENTYRSISFKADYSYNKSFGSNYTGDYYLLCSNNTKVPAKVSFKIFSTDLINNSSSILQSISAYESKVFKFEGQKSNPTSLSIKGGAKQGTSEFSGNCSIFDSEGESTYSSIFFQNDYLSSKVITPNYTGVYYLVCTNNSKVTATFQFSGFDNLKEVRSVNTFNSVSGTTTTVQAEPQNSNSSSSTLPTPSPSVSNSSTSSSTTNQDLTTKSQNLISEAQNYVKKIETGKFTEADIKKAIDAANEAVRIANEAVKSASTAKTNSKEANLAANKALEEAKKITDLANSLKKANASIDNVREALGSVVKQVIAMTVESACRDKATKVSAGLNIAGDVLELVPLVGDKLSLPFNVGASLNDIKAIEKCKAK